MTAPLPDEDDPWASRRAEMEETVEDTHVTPTGERWVWSDPYKDKRKEMLGPHGVPSLLTKSILAKEVFNTDVRRLDDEYSLAEIDEGVVYLSKKNEIDDLRRLRDERDAKAKEAANARRAR